jgi:RNA polymerase sigma factor (sigma-70 family)
VPAAFPGFHPNYARFSTFAIRVTLQRLADIVKNYRGVPLADFEDFDKVVASDAVEPIDQAVNSEDVARVPKLLACLTPRQRLVIYLRFWERRKLQYVAWRLGVSYERVRQIEEQALERMGRRVQDAALD